MIERPRDERGHFLKAGQQAPVRLETVVLTRRDPLAVPSKYRKPGFRLRLVRMSDQTMENEAHIEEMEELGWRVVRDEKSQPVSRRGAVLMEMPEDLYNARAKAKVAANIRANRAMAQSIRDQINKQLAGAPDGEVIGEGISSGQPEDLLTKDELGAAGVPTPGS